MYAKLLSSIDSIHKAFGRGAIPYPEVVEECLCFGWIDSTVKRLDEGRQAQRISPRKKSSTWTIWNTQRFRGLEERGLGLLCFLITIKVAATRIAETNKTNNKSLLILINWNSSQLESK